MPIGPLVAILLAGAVPQPVGPVPPGTLTTSDHCGGCHRAIYETWRESAHARSLDGPVFLDAYRDAVSRQGEKVSKTCLVCHAPMVAVNGDYGLDQKITWEGVSCDVCHSLTQVKTDGKTPRNVLEVGPRKWGPIRDADPMSHEVGYSELHVSSLGCAGCHEYRNGAGTPILSTYSEWQASRSATDGVQCQACHMAVSRADVVDPRVHRVSHAEINLHDVPGGHSLEQLHRALRVRLEPRRDGDEVEIVVGITNRGAGHAVPTGMPGRRVILELTLRDSAGGSATEERIYGRFLQDQEGRRIVRDGDYFAPGVQPESDTRIGADEDREERFRFPLPRTAIGFLSAKLHYEHSPMGTEENRTRFTFFSEDRTLSPDHR